MSYRALLAAAVLFSAAGCSSQGTSSVTADRRITAGQGGDITLPANQSADDAYAFTGSNAADDYWATHSLTRQTVGNAQIDVPANR